MGRRRRRLERLGRRIEDRLKELLVQALEKVTQQIVTPDRKQKLEPRRGGPGS